MKKVFAFLLLSAMFPFSFLSCENNIEVDVSSENVEEETSFNNESEKSDVTDSEISDAPVMCDKIPPESSEPVPETEGSISVVVLGDSIARGYGLENVETQRFSSLLQEDLKTVYKDVSVVNYGVDGQTGAELLSVLQNSPPAELNNCDHVIISIGGNNILQAITSLSSVMDKVGQVDPKAFRDYFLYLFANDDKTKAKYAYSCDVINGIFKEINNAFNGEQFKSLIDKAESDLSSEIPQIVSEIRKNNPNAKIYIQTVYNPYRNVNISLEGIEEELDLSSYGELAVSKLNNPIESLANENGYTVVPIWKRFDTSKKTLTNAGFDISNTRFSVDPHPNANGHIIIANTYFKIFTEAHDD